MEASFRTNMVGGGPTTGSAPSPTMSARSPAHSAPGVPAALAELVTLDRTLKPSWRRPGLLRAARHQQRGSNAPSGLRPECSSQAAALLLQLLIRWGAGGGSWRYLLRPNRDCGRVPSIGQQFPARLGRWHRDTLPGPPAHRRRHV